MDYAKKKATEEGFAEGRAEGRIAEKLDNAKRMKDEGRFSSFIAKITGLTIEEIEKL